MSNNTKQYKPKELKKFENVIVEKLEKTKEELLNLQKNQKAQKEHIANTNVDFNENSKHFQQQAKNKRLIRRLQNKSRELQAALSRIEQGTYGVCERSGELIRAERLMAMPTARFDIARK